MAGRFLLDTNVVIAFFSGEKRIAERLAEAEVFVPTQVLGELYYGARKSARAAENLARIQRFAAAIEILFCDGITAWFYSEVKDRLRLKGHPIPENDIWIAAISIQHGLTLATRDEHFNHVDNLERENW
ncbi:MAG TPA: type II toxin-antitoxin system VapC family toxin [Candidatus Acidoferrum sp.]|nr:type II toxin-antitoxin system VapC family toxin [Candidatus Acidoferrum sp.]